MRRPPGGDGGGAACVTVNVSPPIVMVPVRTLPDVFVATPYATVPPPEPDAPDVTEIQAALLWAVQLQLAPAVTVTEPVPATAPNDTLAGAIAMVQDMAAWVTVKAWPATVIVPVRGLVDVFAATR